MSNGEKLAFAPIGFGEYMLCVLKDESDIEEIIQTGRSGDLRRNIRMGLVKHERMIITDRSSIGIWDKGGRRRLSLLQAKAGSSQLRIETSKKGWKSFGHIVSIERFPRHLPVEKPSEIKEPIEGEKSIITAMPLRWEVLPPGWWRTFKGSAKFQLYKQRFHYDEVERLKFIDGLKPDNWYAGKNYLGERIYYVAVFKSCVIAESATYGNAAYFVFDMQNWQKILSRTKKEVLQLNNTLALKVPHILDWRSKVTSIVSRA
jgi:hypothetical protein